MHWFECVTGEYARQISTITDREHIYVCVPRFNKPGDVKKFVYYEHFKPHYEEVKNMEIYEDDIWVISFPKSGTTWTQEMTWLIGNNLDFETAKKRNLYDRFPLLE